MKIKMDVGLLITILGIKEGKYYSWIPGYVSLEKFHDVNDEFIRKFSDVLDFPNINFEACLN